MVGRCRWRTERLSWGFVRVVVVGLEGGGMAGRSES